jgi:hypothetical protein
MTRGIALAVSVLIVLVAIGSRRAVAAAPETEVDLSVNGIRFGSTYDDVVRSIGRTRHQERERVTDDSCGPPYTDLGLTYDGLFIRMKGTPKGTDFKAVSFDVTSPKWLIEPGIRVGMSEAELRKQIGEPGRTTEVEGTIVQHFVNAGNNGIANFFVKNGTLVRVAWEMKLC